MIQLSNSVVLFSKEMYINSLEFTLCTKPSNTHLLLATCISYFLLVNSISLRTLLQVKQNICTVLVMASYFNCPLR